MMVWSLRVLFALSSCMIITISIDASSGEGNNQAYQVSTLNQILTPYEQSQYLNYGVLPTRVQYDQARGAYVVRQIQLGNNQPPDGYVVMPRWRYWLSNIPSPGSFLGDGGGDGSGLLDGLTNSGPVEMLGDLLSGDEAEFLKDAVTSELGQEAIKMGVSLIPGGSAMLQAYEVGQKLNSATGLTDKIGNKFKKD